MFCDGSAVCCPSRGVRTGRGLSPARGSPGGSDAPLGAQPATLLPLVASRARSVPLQGWLFPARRAQRGREDTAGLAVHTMARPTHSGNPSLGQGCGSAPGADPRTATAGPLPAEFK